MFKVIAIPFLDQEFRFNRPAMAPERAAILAPSSRRPEIHAHSVRYGRPFASTQVSWQSATCTGCRSVLPVGPR